MSKVPRSHLRAPDGAPFLPYVARPGSPVGKWRRAFGVPRVNEGTHALTGEIATSRDDDWLERAWAKSKRPKALRKLSKTLKGRVPSARTLQGALRAAK